MLVQRHLTIISVIFISLIFLQLTNLHALPLRRSCGTDLTERIAKICSRLGGYNVLGSTSSPSIRTEHHHRVRRRVADECCKNICSDTVISQYCYNSGQISRVVDKLETYSDELFLSSSESSEYNLQHNNSFILSSKNIQQKNSILKMNLIYDEKIHYQPLKIGTVAPEFKKTAITPHLLSRIYFFNQK